MLQRNSSTLRASTLVLTTAIVLSGATPHRVVAQTAQAEMLARVVEPVVPTPPAPPTAPAPSVAPVAPPPPEPSVPPAIPPAPPAPPHPIDKEIGPQGNSHRVRKLIDGNTHKAARDAEDLGASKRQREQRALRSKQQGSGRRQWVTNERLRVANEAARREADRMINAASPMDWRNRYSSD